LPKTSIFNGTASIEQFNKRALFFRLSL
jgi:hypothetical protein